MFCVREQHYTTTPTLNYNLTCTFMSYSSPPSGGYLLLSFLGCFLKVMAWNVNRKNITLFLQGGFGPVKRWFGIVADKSETKYDRADEGGGAICAAP